MTTKTRMMASNNIPQTYHFCGKNKYIFPCPWGQEKAEKQTGEKREMPPVTYIVNVEAAIYRGDKFLVIVRGVEEFQSPGALALPGGKVDIVGALDAILEETLRREVREEVSVEIEPGLQYVESKTFLLDTGYPVVDIVFLCRYKGGEPQIRDPHEVQSIHWMSAQEILNLPDAPEWTRRSISLAEELRPKGD
jgi:8-oxo-dGTP diphosphatase